MKIFAESARRLALLASVALVLTGCGVGPVTTITSGALAVTGSVHGGIQPITGATVQLFSVGTGGNGSQAHSLLTQPVTTDSNGAFSLAGTYSCPSSSTQVYAVARGGNPGFSASVNNPGLVLLSAIGSCSNLGSNADVQLNEVTTVAGIYALAQFIAGYDHIGASSTNTIGVSNAFLDAHLLASPAIGLAPQLPSNLTVEPGKLYALADALVPCVNSDGGNACTALYTAATPAGGSAPTDVLTAALNIIRNPGRNVLAVYNLVPSTPPYPTALSAPPNDWTMSLRVAGGGISAPTGLGLDSQGNVWATNFGGDSTHPAGLAGYTAQGTPLSGSPFSPGLQTDSYSLTVDKNDNVWVASYDNVQGNGVGSLAKFMGVSSSSPGALVQQYSDASLNWPESITSDPGGSGTILAANYLADTVSIFNLDGTVSRVLGTNLTGTDRPSFPVSVISDGLGGAWTADQGADSLTHLKADGTVVKSVCCTLPDTVRFDPTGNLWVTNYDGLGNPSVYTFTEVGPDGTVKINQQGGGGIRSPAGAVVDAGGQFWVLDYNSAPGSNYSAFSEFAGNTTTVAPGTPLSPDNGYGLDAHMAQGFAAEVDASGNLWMTVRADDSLRMFFGIATPTAMPANPIPRAP